jgi:histidinol-phosphate phosphatase family protein
MSSGRGRPAVLLDRDGTLNVSPGSYLTRVEELVPIPGAFEAVGRLCHAGWAIAVCTNQACIGKGLVTAAAVDRIHEECARLAARCGGVFDGFHVCPHRPDEGCTCRKPLPGLLLEAARVHGYDLARSYFVGDSPRDVEAGLAAGATPVLVRSGDGDGVPADLATTLVFDDVAAAAEWILARPLAATGA